MLILVTGLVTAGVAYWRMTAALDEEMHSRVMTRSQSLAREVEFLIASTDPGAEERLLDVLAETDAKPARQYAYVEDPSGEIVYSSPGVSGELLASIATARSNQHTVEHDAPAAMAMEEGQHPGTDTMVTMMEQDHGQTMATMTLVDGPSIMDTASPLADGYTLHTGHTLDQMRALTDPVVIPLVALIGLGPLLTIALIFAVTRSVSGPLHRLTSAARALQEGHFGTTVRIGSGDEVGRLTQAFNDMSIGLAERERLRSENRRLSEQVVVDGLTGLFNHRHLQERLTQQLDEAARDGTSLAVIMMDIDDFKLFNDTYGHPVGDEILKLVAGTLTEEAGDAAIVCRYAGDEFLVIIPGANKTEAILFTKRLADAIDRIAFTTRDGARLPVRISLGVAAFPEDAQSKNQLLAQADSAMYDAKQNRGERRVTVRDARPDFGLAVLDTLVDIIEQRDHYTRRHSDIVAEQAARLALLSGLSEEAGHAVRLAGVLHDVGNIVVPDFVLKKPAPLSVEEYDVVKRHPLIGEMLLRELPSLPYLEDVVQAVGAHHERFDGLGYPRGLRGEEIPILGRIMALADAYGAMVIDRPYRKALSLTQIIGEIEAGSGTQFDPNLASLFVADLSQASQPAA